MTPRCLTWGHIVPACSSMLSCPLRTVLSWITLTCTRAHTLLSVSVQINHTSFFYLQLLLHLHQKVMCFHLTDILLFGFCLLLLISHVSGRDQSAHVVLLHQSISRHHAIIQLRDKGQIIWEGGQSIWEGGISGHLRYQLSNEFILLCSSCCQLPLLIECEELRVSLLFGVLY